MIRHGIVIPQLDAPPSSCGGPAWCATCNAEMIELETQAIRLAANEERRYGYVDEAFEALWKSRQYRRRAFRKCAMHLIMIREAEEGVPRIWQRKGARLELADSRRTEALRHGLSMRGWRRRENYAAARRADLTTREYDALLKAERAALLLSLRRETKSGA